MDGPIFLHYTWKVLLCFILQGIFLVIPIQNREMRCPKKVE